VLDNYPYLDIYYPYIDSMQTSELPLFKLDSPELNSQNVTDYAKENYLPTPIQTTSIEKALSAIFPTSQELTKSERARGVIGEASREFTDEQLTNLVSDFEFLACSWLDIFERQTYGGKTLGEILQTL